MGLKGQMKRLRTKAKVRFIHPIKRFRIRQAAKKGPTIEVLKMKSVKVRARRERNEKRYGKINVKLQAAENSDWNKVEKLGRNAVKREKKYTEAETLIKLRTAANYALRAAGVSSISTRSKVIGLLFKMWQWERSDSQDAGQFSENFSRQIAELIGKKRMKNFNKYFRPFGVRAMGR